MLTSESIQLNFSTNIFSKRSEYQVELKKCKRLTHRIDCGIDKLVQNLMKSKKNADLICQLCEDFDQIKVIQKQFVKELENHHANMLQASRRLVKMRNALYEHVVEREFHVPIEAQGGNHQRFSDDLDTFDFQKKRSNSAAMKLKQGQKTIIYQQIRKQTVIMRKGGKGENQIVSIELAGKESNARRS